MASTGPGRLTVLPHEAVLLNSVRRLLAVVPQTEHTIAIWASGAPSQAHVPSGSPGPPGGFLPISPCICDAHPGSRGRNLLLIDEPARP
jgi:hypothetical protein